MKFIKEFLSKYKYFIAVVILAAIIFFVLRSTIVSKDVKQAQKVTDQNITKVQELVASQDRVIERIYTNTIREVQKINVDIQERVQSLDADTVAVELNSLLDQYRRERGRD